MTRGADGIPGVEDPNNWNIIQRYYHVKRHSDHEKVIEHQVLEAESFTALQRQIEQKGAPPPVLKGANKYWSYIGLTDEPRILNCHLRRERELLQIEHRDSGIDGKRSNWDDRAGFLRHFRWLGNGKGKLHPHQIHLEVARSYNELLEDKGLKLYGWGILRGHRSDDASVYEVPADNVKRLHVPLREIARRRQLGPPEAWPPPGV